MSRKNLLAFLAFLIIALIIYFPSRHAGFVMDFLGWQQHFEAGNFWDVFSTFGWHGQQQFFMLFFYPMYKILGVDSSGWYLIFTTVHALNAFLAFTLCKNILARFSISSAATIAFIGSLFFLLGPYQAEVVVWRVCFHYLMITLMILGILHFTISYLESGYMKFFWLILLLLFLSLYTIELALIIPLLVGAMVLLWNQSIEWKKKFRLILKLLLPQFLLITLYFVSNKIVLGVWIGHYGSNVHSNVNVQGILGNYVNYFMKYLLFERFWSFNFKMPTFAYIEEHFIITSILIGCISILFVLAFFGRKFSSRMKLAIWFLAAFFISLTPIANLFMSKMMLSENDRYGYLASLFFSMFLAVAFSFLNKKIFYVLAAGWIVLSTATTLRMVNLWEISNNIYRSLVDDFRWYDRDQVIILNIPDNYHGLWMFRIYNRPSALIEALELIRKKPYHGDMQEVAYFNMMTPTDAVNVTRDSSQNLIVRFSQWSNWWWFEGIGSSEYEREAYRTHLDGLDLHVYLKQLKPNHVIIYQVGDKWMELKE